MAERTRLDAAYPETAARLDRLSRYQLRAVAVAAARAATAAAGILQPFAARAITAFANRQPIAPEDRVAIENLREEFDKRQLMLAKQMPRVDLEREYFDAFHRFAAASVLQDLASEDDDAIAAHEALYDLLSALAQSESAVSALLDSVVSDS